MRNKVREKMLVFFVLENPLKSLHKDFVYRTLKENFELDDKTLGYDFRPESFFPTSWGGGVDCNGRKYDIWPEIGPLDPGKHPESLY